MTPSDTLLWSGDAADWSASAADGSTARLATEGDGAPALRFDFALAGHGAWAIARRESRIVLPEHYVLKLRLRGEATPSELQLKLVGASGASVWWWRRPLFTPARDGEVLVFRRASLRFAWGPASGGDPAELGAVELAVASDDGGSGSLWIEDLRIERRAVERDPPRAHAVRASSAERRHPAEALLGAASGTGWQPTAHDLRPWLELDLGATREWGGLVIVRPVPATPARCRIFGSEDGQRWTALGDETALGARTFLRIGEAESRFVRLELSGDAGGGIVGVRIVPIELAVSPARFAATAAREAPRGRFPRHLLGEHANWAVVGADGGAHKGLLGEDGAIEVDVEGFTLEPFLAVEGRTLTWADVATQPLLAGDSLPIPSVVWSAVGLRLRITAFAAEDEGSSLLVARYEVENLADRIRDVRLLVALRPFQVTPAWQALNLSPAVSPITTLERQGATVRVDDRHRVVSVTAPDAIGTPSPDGWLGDRLLDLERVDEPLGFVEAAFAYDLRLGPRASEVVVLTMPWREGRAEPPAGLERALAASWGEARLADTTAYWAGRLSHIPLVLPPAGREIAESLRASLAWILVNRDGPRIQPGPRCYRRSWIRDGALTGTALAEMGFADEAGAFLSWYASYQLPDGRVPCAIDQRGIDRVPEHDSHGELAWAIVELWRLTGDDGFLHRLWPSVRGAADAIASLRSQRTGDAFRGDPCFGLLPESISHEGYSSQPVHSFWDDLFALRGLGAAADAATAMGEGETRARFEALRDAMRRDVASAVVATMERHGLDVIPGSVELGDFDPTSTAIAFDPCGEEALLPQAALARTFERLWQELEARWRGEHQPDAYTAYEVRNTVAFLRLGWKERALSLLGALVADQRPTAWRQWPEVTTSDPRAARFLGDLPHGWIASSFVRSARRLVVDERRADGVLVVAAGVPEAWVRDGDGVRARGLPTIFGLLDLHLVTEGDDRVRAVFGGACRPPGGIVLFSPSPRPLRAALVDGRPEAIVAADHVAVRAMPREVLLLL